MRKHLGDKDQYLCPNCKKWLPRFYEVVIKKSSGIAVDMCKECYKVFQKEAWFS